MRALVYVCVCVSMCLCLCVCVCVSVSVSLFKQTLYSDPHDDGHGHYEIG